MEVAAVMNDPVIVDFVTLGTLVDEPKIRPSKNIFVGLKAGWIEINDTFPNIPNFPHGVRRSAMAMLRYSVAPVLVNRDVAR